MKYFQTYKKLLITMLCIFMAVSFNACSSDHQENRTEPTPKYTMSTKHKVIIDTDTGGDDASALILAAKSENIDILGVTVLAGNVELEQAAQNALAALEIAGCNVPVYKGAAENYSGEKIDAFSVYGKDGMGDSDLIHPTGKAEDKNAVDYILETVAKYPNEVEIVALGPATNIAKAIERDPDTMKKVKMIWSMGTCGLGPGNASPVAEFNVYSDAYAYKVMLDSGINITVAGLDMCGGDAMWTDEQFEQLSKTNEIGKFVTLSFTKLREFYESNRSGGAVDNPDSMAMMCVVCDNFVNDTIKCHGSCITQQGETYGQVIFYKQGFTYDVAGNDFDYNVSLISSVGQTDYFDLYLQAISK